MLSLRNPRRDICFLVLLDLLALEVRPLGSLAIATIFNWDFMFGVIGRRVRFSPRSVSAFSGMIQGKLYSKWMVSYLREEPERVSVRVRRVRRSTCSDGFMFLDQ